MSKICNDIYKHRDQRLGTNAVTQCDNADIKFYLMSLQFYLQKLSKSQTSQLKDRLKKLDNSEFFSK